MVCVGQMPSLLWFEVLVLKKMTVGFGSTVTVSSLLSLVFFEVLVWKKTPVGSVLLGVLVDEFCQLMMTFDSLSLMA